MPELPDVTVYVEHLARRTVGHPLERIRLASPFLLRTADPPIAAVFGREVRRVSRLGKRIVFTFAPDDEEGGARSTSSSTSWSRGASAGSRRRRRARQDRPRRVRLRRRDRQGRRREGRRHAHPHRGEQQEAREPPPRARRGGARGARAGRPRGPRRDAPTQFAERLRSREPHAEARAHRSAPLQRHRQRVLRRDLASCTHVAGEAHVAPHRRRDRARSTRRSARCSSTWTDRLRARSGEFPEKVTAFQPEMAVHGKYGKPCPRCGEPRAAHPLRRQRDELLPRRARPTASSSPIARSRASCAATGRRRSRRSRRRRSARAATARLIACSRRERRDDVEQLLLLVVDLELADADAARSCSRDGGTSDRGASPRRNGTRVPGDDAALARAAPSAATSA